MKTIAYISEVTNHTDKSFVPSVLGKLYLNARRANAKIGVTSILMYKEGYYFQVLEGPKQTIDRLFLAIQKNPSHQNIQILFESSIARRFFENSPMRLVNSLAESGSFNRYHANFQAQFARLDARKAALFKVFYKDFLGQQTLADLPVINADMLIQAEAKPTAPEAGSGKLSYTGLEVSLSAWPDFNKIRPNPLVLEACAKLIGGWVSHDHYAEQLDAEQREQWRGLIKDLSALGLLKSRDTAPRRPIIAPQPQNNSFYSKLKSFLTGKTTK